MCSKLDSNIDSNFYSNLDSNVIIESPAPSRGQIRADHLREHRAVRGHHEAVLREEVLVRVVECCDGGLADELRVEDLGDEDVGAPLHVQTGANLHLSRPLAYQLYLEWEMTL